MRSTLRLLLLALAVPSLARAQAGMLVGMSFESGDPDFIRGYSLAGMFTIRSTGPLGVRFDAGVQTFNRSVFYVFAPCLPPSVNPGPCGAGPARGNGITVASTTASLVLTEHPSRSHSFYWIAGLGVYALTDTPSDGAYARLGLNGGGGFHMGSKVVFEVRYHGLVSLRTTKGFVPISLGFRF